MSFVVSLTNVTPSPRYDGKPWTDVRWEEAAEAEGPYAVIETQVLGEPDTEPQEPKARNLTTTEAPLEAGWVKLVFIDGGGAEDAPQFFEWPPLSRSSNPVPTLDEMRARSKLLLARYPSPAGNTALQALLFDALPLISNLTGRNIGMVGEGSEKELLNELLNEPLTEGWSWEPWALAGGGREEWLTRLVAVSGRLIAVAKRAVTLKCERLAVGGQVRARIEAHNTGLLRSMTAGPYSEARMTVGEVRQKMMLDPDPQLDECLRLLMTEDAWGIFLYMTTGQQLPGAALTPIDGLKVPGGYENVMTDHWFGAY
jgi:hypothetical protein